MKKLSLVLITLLTLGTFTTYAQGLKLGHVNSAAVLDSVPSFKRLSKYQEELDKDFQAQADILGGKIEKMQRELQAAYGDTSMSQMDIEFLEIDYQTLMTKAQTIEKNYQQNSQTVQNRANQIVEKYAEIVKEVAKAKSFTYVFDSQSHVLYADDSSKDLTDEIREKLIAYDNAKPFYE